MMSLSALGRDLHSGQRSLNVIGLRKIFLGAAISVMLIAGLATAILGINPGIEFRGGSEFTVSNVSSTEQQPAYDALKSAGVEQGVRVSTVGTSAVRVQTQQLGDSDTYRVNEALAKAYGVSEADVTSTFIGPAWGSGVTQKALMSLGIFLLFVSLLMTIYFRNWRMAAAALFALMHDMFVLAGFFALTQIEVSPATVIGFLTILAYSLYDTVVVFDKVRELTKGYTAQYRFSFGELVNLAVNQTFVRSINTSVVALLPVTSILVIGTWLLGAGTLLDIALALFVGMIAGAFSSLFIAPPTLTWLHDRAKRGAEHNAAVQARRALQAEGSTEDKEHVATAAAVRVAPMQSGEHKGQKAQPRRKPRSKR
ncbi:protein translocase subunit SecF [Boudabousia marimammalium]|uniref:Protein-export membrane protein SecF n=1 Tax=Boudabousia marimammalium TaxID=156892 RepID=A0A1Q5PR78_9ACTO|nr:protein translocase subunit SecF [Boudabousia marimammalium]OKL49972.1 protein-export membrane protein SecF [Boudabousia marimammalium]